MGGDYADSSGVTRDPDHDIQDALLCARESEERYRLLVEHSPEAFVIVELPGGTFADCNQRACELYGLPREELIGRTPGELSPPLQPDGSESESMARHLIARCAAGEMPSFEWTHRTPDGRTIECEVRLVRMPSAGRELLRGSVTDISERKRHEEERRRFEAGLEDAQRLEALGVLAGGIAHDFNNLLVSVLGNAELALREVDPGSGGFELLLKIHDAAKRASELTNQLLAYTGRRPVVKRTLDLNVLVRDTTNLLEVALSKRARLDLHTPVLPLLVEADVTQLRQVVMNLVTNASDALGGQAGIITVTTGSATLDAAAISALPLVASHLEPGAYHYVRVTDTGCGMSEATVRRIFEPFFTTKPQGRGLGLAAVIGIIKGHDGDLAVESALGEGTTITAYLPQTEEPARRRRRPDAATDPGWRGEGLALVVDDEPEVREVARAMLSALGYEVHVARGGAEALERLAAEPGGYGVVLLDLTMPEVDGAEVYATLRARGDQTPVLISSGFDQSDAAIDMGSDGVGFLQKPFSVSDLSKALRNLLLAY
jgi:two-component system cell cycle sensor histidine kinase/response regulator CckA